MNKKEAITYGEYLEHFEGVTGQVLRIKNKLDAHRRSIVANLRGPISKLPGSRSILSFFRPQTPNNESLGPQALELVAQLERVMKREVWVKNIVEKGLFTMKREILPELEEAAEGDEEELQDIDKLEDTADLFLEEIERTTSRLRRQKHFIQHPTRDNFKRFMKAYSGEHSFAKKIIEKIAKLRIDSLEAAGRFQHYTALSLSGGVWYTLMERARDDSTDIPNVLILFMAGILVAILHNYLESYKLENDFKEDYGL